MNVWLLALLAMLALAVAGTACDDEESNAQDNAGAEQLEQRLVRTQIVNTLDILGTAGLHDIDESANENNEVQAGAAGPVDRAVLAMAATDWPSELQAAAGELQATLEELHEALETEDPATVGPVAAEAHEQQHDFDAEARNYVAAQVGLPVEEHEEEGGETPTGEAPDGGTTPEETAGETATP